MTTKGLAIFIFILFFVRAHAQYPEKVLNKWSELNPIEKLYLHFDRNEYFPGQTIWFKGYLLSDFRPGDKSSTLFVELLNTSSAIISRHSLPVFGGFTHGQIELPDTLAGGSYLLRAYTATMLNHDPAFIFKKSFFIIPKKQNTTPATIAKPKEIRLEFFPEGGNFISGLSNTIAFKAIDENGLPATAGGVIKKETGEKVAEFLSYHDGMGYFDLLAEEKNTYYAVLSGDESGKRFYLPLQTRKGVVLRIIATDPVKQFEILQRNDDPVYKASYIVGQMQHHIVFNTKLKEDKDEMTGMIRTDNISSGILQVTVFNKEGLPLAERLTFVNNKEYIQQGELSVDTLDFSARGKNHFTLLLKDTVTGSFSVSILDPSIDKQVVRTENIFSSLLLTSDIKGYVHNPAYFFSASNDSVKNALDLVMMTNGWRRFNWNDVMKDSLPGKKYKDPNYITLAGRVNVEGTKKPFADKELLTFIAAGGSGKNMLMLRTDSEGRFRKDSILFFERAHILFNDVKGKKSHYIDVKLDSDSLMQPYLLPREGIELYNPGWVVSDTQVKKMMYDYSRILKEEGIMLEGVTVKGRKKTRTEEVEEKYVSSLFAGTSNKTMDLTEENLVAYRNILDYLQYQVPGLQVQMLQDGSGYAVNYRQQASISSMGEIPMTIFLNEVPSDADAIASIPAHEVALIKVYSSFVGASGNAPGGVLAIYTKKGTDRRSLPASGEVITYKGYSVIKEFYSPDYNAMGDSINKPDNRITLVWRPDVVVADINAKVPIVFYNNDHSHPFKIVIEGMTTEGKMLMIEKTITPKKGF